MATPVINYTSIEYDTLFADLERFALAEVGLDFAAIQDPNDPSAVFLALNAYIGDLLAYNANKWVREVIPTQALRVANFDAWAKGVGFRRSRAEAATGDLTFTVDLDSVAGGPVNIPATMKVASETGEVFEPDTATVVGPGVGVVTATVSGSHGYTVSQAVATSTGLASQRYALTGIPLLEDTLILTVAAVAWTRVEPGQLVQALPTATVFEVVYGNDGTAYVLFGDGINGRIPAVASAIVATYKVGGGYAGNVEVGRITRIQTPLAGVTAVTNSTAFTGGGPEQTLAQGQASLPPFVRANDRCVISDDYASTAIGVAGISKAIADYGVCGSGGCGAPIVVYAMPSGGGSLTTTQIRNISSAIRSKRAPNKKVLIRDATKVQLALTVDLFVDSGSKAADVSTMASNAVVDEYDLASLTFGAELSVQRLYDILEAARIRGLTKAFVRRFTVLANYGRYRAGTAGNGTIENISSTVDARREWRVLVTSGGTSLIPGTFEVWYGYTGVISSLSTQSMSDDSALFPASNAFVGASWYLTVDPEDSASVAQLVTGNTETSVTASGATDLREFGSIGDPYVVEKKQTATGKIFRETVAGAVAGGAATLALGVNWAIGDKLRVTDGTTTFDTAITGGISGAWTISPAVPAAGLTTTIADARWASDDGELSFVVKQGSVVWAAGDELFVDTYPTVGDVAVRRVFYPELLSANLTLRTIGGR